MTVDRRVKYTKMVLRESLIKMLRDKPISRIAIKALCEDADINRATFYAHFTDQFDLLSKIQEEFIEDIISYIDGFCFSPDEKGLKQMILKIFEYIAVNSELCRALLGKNGDTDFQADIMKIVSRRIFFEWLKNKRVEEDTAEYIYIFAATGGIGVIRKWLSEGNPKPPQEMAELVTRLACRGIEGYIVKS